MYCRIRPFLPGQSRKHTTIEYIGENGELVVTNPAKQGKDSRRMFKFNKVFGPAATQGYASYDILYLALFLYLYVLRFLFYLECFHLERTANLLVLVVYALYYQRRYF